MLVAVKPFSVRAFPERCSHPYSCTTERTDSRNAVLALCASEGHITHYAENQIDRVRSTRYISEDPASAMHADTVRSSYASVIPGGKIAVVWHMLYGPS